MACPRQMVHAWLKGEKVPSEKNAARLRDLYGIDPTTWDEGPAGKGPSPASFRPEGKATTSIEDVEQELTALRELSRKPTLKFTQRVRLQAEIRQQIALKHRLEQDRKLFDNQIVREHPAWIRIRAFLVEFSERLPAVDREALATKLEREEWFEHEHSRPGATNKR